MFGRKLVTRPMPRPQAMPAPPNPSGHANVLDQLRREEAGGNTAVRPQTAARALFDLLYCRMADSERGTRVEDLLGVLGACGGFACIVAVQHMLRMSGQSADDIGLMVVQGSDGRTYYFGDVPNTLLLESEQAVLSLALGAAQASGAAVSIERVHEEMKHVAATLGSPAFGASRIVAPHRPARPLRESIATFWPAVGEALDLYQVAPGRRPAAIGFAIQQAIDTGRTVIDPLLAADIVVEAAVAAAKLDPKDFGIGG